MDVPLKIRVAHVVDRTEAEGPGVRTAIWTQGCSIRCPGCCNPELFGRRGGDLVAIDVLVARVLAAGTVGITLLGGEPLDQPDAVTALAQAVRAHGLTGVVFSGYGYSEVARRAPDLLDAIDVLVDGPFDASQPESGPQARRWVGSINQGLHFFGGRYGPADFQGQNTVELRLRPDGVMINGWPHP